MKTRLTASAALAAMFLAGIAQAGYDVQVDLKNLSGEVKTDWPVILRVYGVFGRDLAPAVLRAGNVAVRDGAGTAVPCLIAKVPPYDQPGNDEVVFVVPRIEPGQTLSYRVLCGPGPEGEPAKIDLPSSPHNLLGNGGFETVEDGRPVGFTAPAQADTAVKHSGAASLKLSADNKSVSAGCAKKVPLHKGSWYYFGGWSRTDGVARFGYQAGGGGYFHFTARDAQANKDVPAFAGSVMPQCSTRDWLKVTFEPTTDEWGNDRHAAQAAAEEAAVGFELRQPSHFYMEGGKTRGTWWLDDLVLLEQPEVTVRHDLAVKPLTKDGVFLFTRPVCMPLGWIDELKRGQKEWCGLPYAHEAILGAEGKPRPLEADAVKGQRVSFCIGVYHTRQLKQLSCRLALGGVTLSEAPAQQGQAQMARIPVELIEYCPGYLGDDRGRYMQVLSAPSGAAEPVSPAGQNGVRYFFLTFHVPADARAGEYHGAVELLEGGQALASVPLVLRVQDMVQPLPQDVFVGLIYQGNNPRFDEEGMTVYARSGFNCVTRFGSFLDYQQDANGKWQVDLDKLDQKMMWMKKFNLAAVCVFSDFDLGPKWDGGALLKRVRPANFSEGSKEWGERLKTAEAAWKAQIQRIEAARKAHPAWPVFIYMTFDEPNLGGGRNGKPVEAMGWLNQVSPEALTTLDVQFDPLPVCLKWYRVPAFDDPADWAGPEIYRWVGRQGKYFGYCGAADKDEAARYQPGMMMISTGGKYFHAWHLTGGHVPAQVAYDGQTKKLLRAISMINWGDGMNDLKAYCLLRDAIAAAKKAGRGQSKEVAAAESYLKGVFAVFNGDHKKTWTLQPYLGRASDWGYERFYDDWQEQMLRHAAAVLGVRWID